eukprot:488113-Prymnesium_polylepis.2
MEAGPAWEAGAAPVHGTTRSGRTPRIVVCAALQFKPARATQKVSLENQTGHRPQHKGRAHPSTSRTHIPLTCTITSTTTISITGGRSVRRAD